MSADKPAEPRAAEPAPDARRQLAALPLAVITVRPDLSVASVNPAAEQFFGQSNRRLAGRSLFDVLSFAEPLLVARLRDGDAPISARQIDVTIAGIGHRRLDITVAPVGDHPGWQMLTLLDSAAAEAMGESAGGGARAMVRGPEILAHEIKNPLAGIKGAAQLLARKVEGHDRALTSLISDEVDRIAKLIDQMQSLSRRTPDPVEPCNLHEAIRRASAILAAAENRRMVRIEEEFDPSLPPVLGSAHGLVQVLINLIANATDACAANPNPRVILRTRFASGLQLHTTDGGQPVRLPIEVRVSDNGPGIDPAMRDHIFEPFVTSKKAGQGLGLALVRKLVRDMNGHISHDRDEARGWTHFRLHLPMYSPPARQRPRARKQDTAGAQTG